MREKHIATLPSGVGVVVMILSAVLLFSACSSTPTLSTRASQVRLISAMQAHEVEAQCEFLGNVTGIYPYNSCCLFGFNLYGSYWNYNDYALNELLDNAAELGATHVFVNLGNGLELRGEAYLCAYCADPYGNPDVDYCLDFNGGREEDFCLDAEGSQIGVPRCEGAKANNPEECKANRGRWVPGILQPQCEIKGHTWVLKSVDRKTCDSRGGTWRSRAKDQTSCETKGGRWIVNEDVLRSTLSPTKGQKEGGGNDELRKRMMPTQ